MSVLLLIVVVAVGVLIAVGRNEAKRSRSRAATVELAVTRLGVRRTIADGREEHVTWDDLEVVEVVRASMGAHKASGGVVLLGAGPEQGCLVPIDRVGPSGLLEPLSVLPGFDLRAFSDALEVRPPARVVVWRRDPGDDEDADGPHEA